jgi:hypothetical protein
MTLETQLSTKDQPQKQIKRYGLPVSDQKVKALAAATFQALPLDMENFS